MFLNRSELWWPQPISILAASILTVSFVYGTARPVHSGRVVPAVAAYSEKSTVASRENTVLKGKEVSRGSKSNWSLPLKGTVSSAYGWRHGDFHHGIDYAVPSGTLVRSSRPGRVAKLGSLGVYGLTVIIDHGGGVQSLYAHNSRLLVKVGQYVEAGQGIAYSGNTGRTTGPHLHFEIRVNGLTVDPSPYLAKVQVADARAEMSSQNKRVAGKQSDS